MSNQISCSGAQAADASQQGAKQPGALAHAAEARVGAVVHAYPSRWQPEMVRNDAGRRFWLVSRFLTRTECEYVCDPAGRPMYFRSAPGASKAAASANSVSGSAAVTAS